MLSNDQLTKVKGILSAREGTQIPKFLNAGKFPPGYFSWLQTSPGGSWEDYLKSILLDLPTSEKQTNELAEGDKEKSNTGGVNLATGTITSGLQTNTEQEALLKKTAPVTTTTITAALKTGEEEKEKEKEKERDPTKSQILLDGITKVASDFTANFLDPNHQDGTTPPGGGLNTGGNPNGATSGGSLGGTTGGAQLDLQKVQVPGGASGGSQNSNRKSGVQITQWGVKKPRNLENKKVKWGEMSSEERTQYIEAIGQKGGQYAKMAGTAIDTASALAIDKADYADDSWTNSQGREMYDNVSNSLMSMGGYGAMAGAAMKAVGLINDLGGSKTQDFTKDTATINLIGGSYGGTVSDIDEAASKAGKKYGLFESGARDEANAQIDEARRKQNKMAGIAKTARDLLNVATSMSLQNALNYLYQINGGYDQRYLRAAKEGGNIEYFKDPFKVTLSDVNEFKVELSDTPTLFKTGGTLLDKLDANVFHVVLTDVPELKSYKQGGAIKDREIEVIETNTTLKSVIPEGALHKNKHHLDTIGVDVSELTKKGIPVVDNQGELQAEIELNEIIFTLEVTKELESRYKEFYEEGTSSTKKDELAIEAGKLLWKEILYNTDDRTGLIDTLKLGGQLKQSETPEAFKHFVETLPKNLLDTSNYRLEDFWKFNGKPKDFKEAVQKGMFSKLSDGWHAQSVAENPNTGEIEYMKSEDHPTRYMESDWYEKGLIYNDDGTITQLAPGVEGYEDWKEFTTNYELQKTSPYWKYVRKTTSKHKQGGTINNIDLDEITKMVKQALINILTNNG